ncbi:amidohydrolase family protein [Bradyrhizobium sp. LHD-71]|uniref:amidohydrolase family protein n=1 Tax=Bradyrhizobium sp. LHD-71 TaxID=3072141 RepID=UPI00280D3952|nr:amidohydrolase family protein [Bradyrhizobium sp. LHD-71]MDQ8728247.1 amidohydrolase family protein [Bradyrhizobium sp. LHD-71]
MASVLLSGVTVMRDGTSPVTSERHDVLIDGDRIKAIEPAGTIGQADERIAGGDLIATAGLINGHLHSWDHFIKGRVENLPMEVMMAHLRPVVPLPVTADEIYLRTMMTAIESLRTGATTIVDDMSLGQTFDRSHVEAALQAYEDSGLRVYLGFSMIDKPVVDSWPFVEESFAPDTLQWLRGLPRPRGGALLELVRDLAKTHHPRSARVGVIVAPSAPQRCTDDFLRACRALADELDLPVIVHVLETRMQAVTAELFWGKSMVEHLDALGFLKSATALVHGVWLSPRDRELIAKSGASVQYNPWSNASIGSGAADFRALRDAGINVSMGSDGCGVTFTCSMLLTLKFGAGIGRIRTTDHRAWPTAAEIWDAATIGGARALGREHEIGRLAPGYKADLVLYRKSSMPMVPLNVPVRQLVHGEAGAGIDAVVVDGRVVMRDGRLTTVNEASLIAKFKAAHENLLDRICASEASSQPLLEGLERIYERCLSLPISSDVTRGVVGDYVTTGCCS